MEIILTNIEKSEIIQAAKDKYLKAQNDSCITLGICSMIHSEFSRVLLEKIKDQDSPITDLSIDLIKPLVIQIFLKEFPELNREFLRDEHTKNIGEGLFWWDLDNSESRIKAFDKLINHYQQKQD